MCSLKLILIRVIHALTICDSYIFVGHLTVYTWPQAGSISARAYQHGRHGFASISAVFVQQLFTARIRAVKVIVTTILFALVTAPLRQTNRPFFTDVTLKSRDLSTPGYVI